MPLAPAAAAAAAAASAGAASASVSASLTAQAGSLAAQLAAPAASLPHALAALQAELQSKSTHEGGGEASPTQTDASAGAAQLRDALLALAQARKRAASASAAAAAAAVSSSAADKPHGRRLLEAQTQTAAAADGGNGGDVSPPHRSVGAFPARAASVPLSVAPPVLLPFLTWPAGVVQAYGLPSRRPAVMPLARPRRTHHHLRISNVAWSDAGELELSVDAAPWIGEALPFMDGRRAAAAQAAAPGAAEADKDGAAAGDVDGAVEGEGGNSTATVSASSSSARAYDMSRDLARDLPFFVPDSAQHGGIHCRFGQPGAQEQASYGAGRNFIAMVRGYKRFIMTPPDQCRSLSIARDGPTARHSQLDWNAAAGSMYGTSGALASAGSVGSTAVSAAAAASASASQSGPSAFGSLAGASALEVVLEPGDVLYVPPMWFSHVISLTVSVQCNARSGTPAVGDSHITAASCGGGMPQPPITEDLGRFTDADAVAAVSKGGGGSGSATPRLLPPIEYARISLGAEADAVTSKAIRASRSAGAAVAAGMGKAIFSKTVPQLVAALQAGSNTLPRRDGRPVNAAAPDMKAGLAAVHSELKEGLKSDAAAAMAPLVATAAAAVGAPAVEGDAAALAGVAKAQAEAARKTQLPLDVLVPPSARLPALRMVALLAAVEADEDAEGDSPHAKLQSSTVSAAASQDEAGGAAAAAAAAEQALHLVGVVESVPDEDDGEPKPSPSPSSSPLAKAEAAAAAEASQVSQAHAAAAAEKPAIGTSQLKRTQESPVSHPDSDLGWRDVEAAGGSGKSAAPEDIPAAVPGPAVVVVQETGAGTGTGSITNSGGLGVRLVQLALLGVLVLLILAARAARDRAGIAGTAHGRRSSVISCFKPVLSLLLAILPATLASRLRLQTQDAKSEDAEQGDGDDAFDTEARAGGRISLSSYVPVKDASSRVGLGLGLGSGVAASSQGIGMGLGLGVSVVDGSGASSSLSSDDGAASPVLATGLGQPTVASRRAAATVRF